MYYVLMIDPETRRLEFCPHNESDFFEVIGRCLEDGLQRAFVRHSTFQKILEFVFANNGVVTDMEFDDGEIQLVKFVAFGNEITLESGGWMQCSITGISAKTHDVLRTVIEEEYKRI